MRERAYVVDVACRWKTLTCRARSNYALEQAVTGCGWRAARVRKDFALAARWNGFARPARRGR
jgi:hypothetical protein